MAVLTNLETLIDSAVSVNVNAQAANQAVIDSTAKATEAANSATAASTSKDDANTIKGEVEVIANQAVTDIGTAGTQAEANVQVLVDEAAGHVVTTGTNATNALNSENAASGYATDAGTQAGIATTKATEADVHRANAVAAKDQALTYLTAASAKYDLFDDRFLGGHGSHPYTDNDGNTLQEAALYWNMVDKEVYIWSGSSWSAIKDSNGGLLIANNLSDLPDIVAARTNLDVMSTTEVADAIQVANLANSTTYDVVDNTAKNALTGLEAGDKIFVRDDGDTKWAHYLVLTTDGTGSGSTYQVIMDENTYLNANTAASVKSTYESNANTNEFNDAEKTKLGTIESNAKDDQLASEVPYTNTTSGLTATDVQNAVDEIDSTLDTHIVATGAHGVGEVVGTTEVQTLTNKTLIDATNTVYARRLDVYCKNTNGQAILKGNPVKFTEINAQDSFEVELANQAVDIATGIAAEDIPVDGFGLVVTAGRCPADTSNYTEGQILYVGNKVLTDVEPTTGYSQPIAVVMKDSVTGYLDVLATYPKQDATDVRYDNATSGLAAIRTQDAIDEVEGRVDTAETKLAGIEVGATADQLANEVPVTPQGNLSSNTVQLALEELQGDIDTLNTITEW